MEEQDFNQVKIQFFEMDLIQMFYKLYFFYFIQIKVEQFGLYLIN